jgi:predicted GNAT family acetyltransferase
MGMATGTSATEAELPIQHDQSREAGVFYVAVDGERLAHLSYGRSGGGANIEHTYVSDRLRGQGVARRLVDAAVAWARQSGTKLSATCSYAKSVFDKDPSLRDVLE